jgi:hypothetical protein
MVLSTGKPNLPAAALGSWGSNNASPPQSVTIVTGVLCKTLSCVVLLNVDGFLKQGYGVTHAWMWLLASATG